MCNGAVEAMKEARKFQVLASRSNVHGRQLECDRWHCGCPSINDSFLALGAVHILCQPPEGGGGGQANADDC